MRIITGKYKGRIIHMPKGIRPTQGLVRKALFDILGDTKGLLFLELFAGSGAVGIEALSKGAERAVFVESNPSCIKALKSNFPCLLPATYYLLPLDVFKALKQIYNQGQKFDIIFLDPPYYRPEGHGLASDSQSHKPEGCGLPSDRQSHKDIAKKTLQTLEAYDILAPNGFTVVQHFKKDILPENVGNLSCFKQAKYGDTILSFYKKL